MSRRFDLAQALPLAPLRPAGGDGADPSAGMVSSRADVDFKQLIEAVEQDLATGRACQAFVRENGLVSFPNPLPSLCWA